MHFAMNGNKCIALIGLSTLEGLGITSLLQEEWPVRVESFSSFPEFLPFADNVDAYVVALEIFAGNTDFFMPRKQKSVMVSSTRGMMQGSGSAAIITPESDETEIRSLLEALRRSLKDVEGHPGELSTRETEVLRLIAAGKINKEIADALCISVNTVITHRKNISSKLGIKSASGLSLYAAMNGLI